MKKTIIKGVYLGAVFFLSLFIISALMNKGNTDMTAEMAAASYPVVCFELNGSAINYLHAYDQPMEPGGLRDTITPLTDGRRVRLAVQTFGNTPVSMGFEVRSIDGKRLIEDTPITDYTEEDGTIRASITLKDLIDQETEYTLVILLNTKDGETLRYYTRVVQAEDYHAGEKIDYVLDFHQKTFDKEEAAQLTKYLESNSEGDNSSFGHINIHSSLDQVTWGELSVERLEEPDILIKELDAQTASIELSYPAAIRWGDNARENQVREFYRIRYTKDRVYLLDYERTMDQLFLPEEDVYSGNKIMLGILSENVPFMESDGGNVFAFVNGDRLYSYNITENKMAVLFGFYDEDNEDRRSTYDAHDIKLLNVDETGNVQFIVYGYMNRGRHEGETGVCVYYYSSVTNTVEEQAFIPYERSWELLKSDVEKLSYLNRNNVLFLMLDGSVYAVDLTSRTWKAVVSGLVDGSYQVSDSNRMLVWQEGSRLYESESLVVLNLNSGRTEGTSISSGAGEYIAPLGFMGEDLIYGLARKSDVMRDEAGAVSFPMYRVQIRGEDNEVLKTYEQEGVYVTGAEITDNQINLHRVVLDEETGALVKTSDDQIMNTRLSNAGSNFVETVVTEKYEKVTQIAVKSTINEKNMKFLTPREVIFEGSREIAIEGTADEAVYYVYGMDGLQGVYSKPSGAVKTAYELAGVVVDRSGRYIWRKGNRMVRNQIMAITEEQVTEEKGSLAVCLDTILKFEGVPRNTEYMLNSGQTAMQILEENMEDSLVMDLGGCSLDSVLYYVNQDIPVLAILNDGNAVLVTGFNELNTVIMEPAAGTLYKKGMNDTKEWFEENGNRFITYVRREE